MIIRKWIKNKHSHEMMRFRIGITIWSSLHEPVQISGSSCASAFVSPVYWAHGENESSQVRVSCYRFGSHERVRNIATRIPTHELTWIQLYTHTGIHSVHKYAPHIYTYTLIYIIYMCLYTYIYIHSYIPLHNWTYIHTRLLILMHTQKTRNRVYIHAHNPSLVINPWTHLHFMQLYTYLETYPTIIIHACISYKSRRGREEGTHTMG